MYSVTVSDSIMVAHSLKGAVFGPAQRLHGATYVVEVQLRRDGLDRDNIVADIGRARALLAEVLAPLAYRNLDEVPEFKGRQTTTEFLARHVFEQMKVALKAGKLGADSDGVSKIRVTMHESHVARGWYEAAV